MDNLSYIAMRPVWDGEIPVGLSQRDRALHCWIIGRSGSGKTTLLHNLLVQDIEAGRGFAFIDPHGDEAEALLDCIPPHRLDEVAYLDPADPDFAFSWNVLAHVPAERRPYVASSVTAIFRHLFADSWGPRSEYIAYNTLAALLSCPPGMGVSLLGVSRMLADEAYRARVVGYADDVRVRSFWEDEFGRWDQRFRAEAIAPLQNKVGALLGNPALRAILGQSRRAFDPRFAMDNRRILIANLAKGALGEQEANFLGSLVVSSFATAALARAEMPEERREPFHLVVDEFHAFTTTSFADLLSEARKYGLHLTLAHQFLDQLPNEIAAAVFGNVGTMIAFRLGARDAPLLEREFAPYPATTLLELSRFEVCVKLMTGGEIREPFLARTLPPLATDFGRRELAAARSRRHFCRPRAEVEGKIERWSGGA